MKHPASSTCGEHLNLRRFVLIQNVTARLTGQFLYRIAGFSNIGKRDVIRYGYVPTLVQTKSILRCIVQAGSRGWVGPDDWSDLGYLPPWPDTFRNYIPAA